VMKIYRAMGLNLYPAAADSTSAKPGRSRCYPMSYPTCGLRSERARSDRVDTGSSL
jgi:hypothetical protein